MSHVMQGTALLQKIQRSMQKLCPFVDQQASKKFQQYASSNHNFQTMSKVARYLRKGIPCELFDKFEFIISGTKLWNLYNKNVAINYYIFRIITF